MKGVRSSVVNLMKQTLTIEFDSVIADTVEQKIETIVHSHEPDVEVIDKHLEQ